MLRSRTMSALKNVPRGMSMPKSRMSRMNMSGMSGIGMGGIPSMSTPGYVPYEFKKIPVYHRGSSSSCPVSEKIETIDEFVTQKEKIDMDLILTYIKYAKNILQSMDIEQDTNQLLNKIKEKYVPVNIVTHAVETFIFGKTFERLSLSEKIDFFEENKDKIEFVLKLKKYLFKSKSRKSKKIQKSRKVRKSKKYKIYKSYKFYIPLLYLQPMWNHRYNIIDHFRFELEMHGIKRESIGTKYSLFERFK